jgi:hypothetical protein
MRCSTTLRSHSTVSASGPSLMKRATQPSQAHGVNRQPNLTPITRSRWKPSAETLEPIT